MNPVLTVLRKEVRDNLRDRRTLLSSLGVAIGGPLLFLAFMAFVLDEVVADADEAIELPVVGADHAPNLVASLRAEGVVIVAGPPDAEAAVDAVAAREHPLVLAIDAAYAEAFRAGRPAAVRIIHDSSRRASSERDRRQVMALLERIGRITASMRLQVRGIDPALLRPIMVQTTDVASPAARAATALGMIPYFLIFSVFLGGFYLAIDTTAGERDLGALEPLLLLPVSRDALALGKLGATLAFALLSLALATLSFYVAFAIEIVPLEDLGMTLFFGPVQSLRVFLSVAPLALLAAALMMVVASFTNSFKEAQSWLSPVILLPTMPLLLLGILAPEANTLTMLVPSLGQALLVFAAIGGEPLQPMLQLTSTLATLAYGGLLTLVALRLYRREGLLG